MLGPLFLPVYLVCCGFGERNPFERSADRYARSGRGWWQWGLASRSTPGGVHGLDDMRTPSSKKVGWRLGEGR